MCEEKEGVMRNARTTRAPGGAKNIENIEEYLCDPSRRKRGSGRGEAPNAAAANASNSSSPVCATTQAGFYTVPNWGNVTR